MRSCASELGALGVALAVSSALLLVCPARLLAEGSRTASEATHLERSTSSTTQAEQARRWAITVEDWQRYERLMTGPRGTWSPHLDPVTALGVHAESEAERRRYAEILVRLERERTEREFAFERMVQQVKRELYPNDLPFDPAKLEELLVQARTREPPFPGRRSAPPVRQPGVRRLQPADPASGRGGAKSPGASPRCVRRRRGTG